MNTLPQHVNDNEDDLDIVIVDDDSLTHEIIIWMLRNTDIRYRLFIEPCEALQYLTKQTPRLLIVDYYMPSMNGLEFLSELKREKPLDSVVFYLCSAATPSEEHLQQLHQLGGRTLDKEQICHRASLLELITGETCITGKTEVNNHHSGACVAAPDSHDLLLATTIDGRGKNKPRA